MINIMTQLNTLISTSNPSDISFIFASYVKGNLKNIESMSIDEIAQVCNTSSSSISRLVSKMGFSSYKVFRKECSETLKMIRANRQNTYESKKQYGLTPNTVDTFFNDYLVPQLKKIKQSDVEKMGQWLSNDRLYFFGSLDIHFVLEETQVALASRPSGSPIVLSDITSISSLKADDHLIVVSVVGNSINTVKAMNTLKKCKAHKYLLTSSFCPLKNTLELFDDVIQLDTTILDATINNYLIRFFMEMVQTQAVFTFMNKR